MNITGFVISPEIIKALSWTLLHSLWQGTLILTLVSVLLWFAGKKAATLRYHILCASLVLILVSSVVTFQWMFNIAGQHSESTEMLSQATSSIIIDKGAQDASPGLIQSFQNYRMTVGAFIEQYSIYLALFWFIGVLLFMTRYLGGLYYIGQLKRRGSFLAGEHWQQKAVQLARRSGVRKGVKILESIHVKVPLTVGHLKPVILFPLGMLGSIPPEQLEAIILHEMAHIFRRDYLVNLLQSIMEALFFYHPAVWLISKMIRDERENICDDIAVKQLNDPITYIKALTNMEELTTKSPAMVTSFAGNKKRLLNRVKRMIQPGVSRFRPTEGLITIVIMTALVVLFGAGTGLNPLKAEASLDAGGPAINPDAISLFAPGYFSNSDIDQPSSNRTDQDNPAGIGDAYAPGNYETVPDTTKALTEEEKQKAQQEREIAEQEAKTRLKEAKAMQEDAMKAYQEAMEQYHDVMKDLQMEQFENQLEWVYKLDSLDSGVIVLKHMSPDKWVHSGKDLDFDFDVDVDIPEHQFFEFEGDEPGTYSYSYRYSTPKRMEVHSDDGKAEIIIKQLEDEALWDKNLELELKRIEKDIYGIHKDIDRKVIVKPDIRAHHPGNLDEFFFIDKGSSPERYIRQELIDDGLIFRGKDYIVELNTNSMYINGEKQPKDVFKKYKKIYEGAAEKSLDVPVKMVF